MVRQLILEGYYSDNGVIKPAKELPALQVDSIIAICALRGKMMAARLSKHGYIRIAYILLHHYI